jgi:hypothetical protein
LAWGVWIGFDWLRTGADGGLLWVRWWTFGFLRHGVSYVRLGLVSGSNTPGLPTIILCVCVCVCVHIYSGNFGGQGWTTRLNPTMFLTLIELSRNLITKMQKRYVVLKEDPAPHSPRYILH